MIQVIDFEEAKLPRSLLKTITNGQLVLITNAGNPVAILSITQSAINDSQPISTSSRQLDTTKGLSTEAQINQRKGQPQGIAPTDRM